jgi:hypothetical protein
METYFSYIIKATCCLSFFYVASLLLFRNHTGFKLQRMYLGVSVALALLLPLNHFSLNPGKINVFTVTQIQPVQAMKDSKLLIKSDSQSASESSHISSTGSDLHSISLTNILFLIYWSVLIILATRLLFSVLYINICYVRSERKKIGRYTIIYSKSVNSSFSFLNWIFVNAEEINTNGNHNIINHELVHAAQYHSLDAIVIELLSAVMWFNPLIWLTRRWMQQLHEYLADEGVLNTGTNVLEYQALLVNQVAGGRLICLPSGFNKSLIKKRLAMMTKTRTKQKKGYLIILLPLTGLMFLGLSFTNKKETPVAKSNLKATALIVSNQLEREKPSVIPNEKVTVLKPLSINSKISGKQTDKLVTAVSPNKMNVFYIGVSNPITVAVSDISSKNVTVKIDNGKISGSNGTYNVLPSKVGKATVTIYDGSKQIGSWDFRVKYLPDPVTKVARKKSGTISMVQLLDAGEVVADLENFDFDARFEIVEFTVFAKIENVENDEISKSAKFTNEQRALIKRLKPGDRLTFTDIKAKGPDGGIRSLNGIIFTIE